MCALLPQLHHKPLDFLEQLLLGRNAAPHLKEQSVDRSQEVANAISKRLTRRLTKRLLHGGETTDNVVCFRRNNCNLLDVRTLTH